MKSLFAAFCIILMLVGFRATPLPREDPLLRTNCRGICSQHHPVSNG
jgi:hypothetical protein